MAIVFDLVLNLMIHQNYVTFLSNWSKISEALIEMFYPVVTSVEQRENLDSHEESNLRPLGEA